MDDDSELARRIQHTEVGATADRDRILEVLDECLEYGFDGAMVQPCWVPLAADRLADTDVKVCTALGYPLGGESPLAKATGIRDAIASGADELDVMANVGFLKSGENEAFRRELDALVEASGDATIKLMSELGGLTEAEADREIEYAVDAGFDYVKNSSGFGAGGQATVEYVEFIAERTPEDVGVKASGGIKTAAQARELLDAGADLLGASSGVEIVTGSEADDGY